MRKGDQLLFPPGEISLFSKCLQVRSRWFQKVSGKSTGCWRPPLPSEDCNPTGNMAEEWASWHRAPASPFLTLKRNCCYKHSNYPQEADDSAQWTVKCSEKQGPHKCKNIIVSTFPKNIFHPPGMLSVRLSWTDLCHKAKLT